MSKRKSNLRFSGKPLPALRVKVTSEDSSFAIVSDEFKITYEISGAIAPSAARIQNFAAWAVLPIGMAEGRSILIEGSGDSQTEQNATALSRIWASWLPQKFAPVTLKFLTTAAPSAISSDMDLVFFSGGADSTYTLLQRAAQRKNQALLTVHGLDYKTDDEQRFQDLIKKTDPFAALVSPTRLFVKTNIYDVHMKFKVKPNLGFVFALASAAFLWDGLFRSIEIASDFARHQEFLIFPWGGNSATNRHFASASMGLKTAQLDVTRSEKMAAIAGNEIALHAATFCANYSARPHNCGVCPKCIRTKAMFLATIKKIPPIFLDNSWNPEFLKLINLNTQAGFLVFMDFYMEAVKNGTQENIPGMIEKFNDFFFPSRMTRFRRALKISNL